MIEDGPSLRHLSEPIPKEHKPFTRFNDGACDNKGRYIAGTLCSKKVPGQLYMYDPADSSCRVIDPGPFTVKYTLLCSLPFPDHFKWM